ncbi:Asp23/Gls24 family envelope stress response protein [Serpentinicella alkaliphila]|uniref:Putative alkaline shock family protein YloU n=1 Tax=Serpentinicella alkaliphila TaxID=1734049 RepID=A0A4R2TYW3_9FIRM|nr:Asp23/Gls24 family envelope stress response protein [Serpentinicella alkaliphila]QUH26642.1 Asp23/Gls24 family envelope stress response protein [Serpentinicella alkaliphila]TCQ02889.1 putative alkaline shock family protein YloU [Serpentinicella alkaliphila]
MEAINTLEYGEVKIASEVVATIVGLAALEVKGVAGMSGGLANGIAEKLGKKSLSKGVKLEIKEKEVIIDLYIIVDYGTKIPDISWEIQNNVIKVVETMIGLKAMNVNIHVQGVHFPQEPAKQENQ